MIPFGWKVAVSIVAAGAAGWATVDVLWRLWIDR